MCIIKYWLPHAPAIRCFPQTSAGRAEVINLRVAGNSRYRSNSPGAMWSNETPLHSEEEILIVLLSESDGCRNDDRKDNKNETCETNHKPASENGGQFVIADCGAVAIHKGSVRLMLTVNSSWPRKKTNLIDAVQHQVLTIDRYEF